MGKLVPQRLLYKIEVIPLFKIGRSFVWKRCQARSQGLQTKDRFQACRVPVLIFLRWRGDHGGRRSCGHGRVTAAIVGGDDPGALATGKEGPDPADDDHDLVGKADEEEDVDHEPGEPGEEAAEFQPGDHGDGAGVPNGGHGALVPVLGGKKGTGTGPIEDGITD